MFSDFTVPIWSCSKTKLVVFHVLCTCQLSYCIIYVTNQLQMKVFYNMGNVGSELYMSRVCVLCNSFVPFLPAVVHFHYCRRLTHLAERFCLVQGASCVFASMMLVYSFLGCELHLDSVFVMLVTSASGSWSKTWHHLLQRPLMVQCIRITVMKSFNNNTAVTLEQNLNIVECGYQGNRTKTQIILIKVLPTRCIGVRKHRA